MRAKHLNLNVTLAGSKLTVHFDGLPNTQSLYLAPGFRPRALHALRRLPRHPEYFFQLLHDIEEATGETLN